MAEEKNIVAQLRQDRKVLWIAVGCGLLATILLSINLREEKPEMVSVLVASQRIAAGGTISSSTVRKELQPKAYVPERHVPPDYLDQYGEFQSNINIEPGELILWSYVKTGDESGLSQALNTEHNMRLISVAVDEVKGIAGHVKQNDIVDVLWTGTIPGTTSKARPMQLTKVLLEGVTVAAIGTAGAGQSQYGGGRAVPTSITLKLSQDEAALLTFAESVGEIKLILSHQDVLPSNLKGQGEGVEVGYANIKKSKTISKVRREYIRITYGSDKR